MTYDDSGLKARLIFRIFEPLYLGLVCWNTRIYRYLNCWIFQCNATIIKLGKPYAIVDMESILNHGPSVILVKKLPVIDTLDALLDSALSQCSKLG